MLQSFFDKVAGLKAKIPTQVFTCEYSQILINSFSIEHLRWWLLRNQHNVLTLLKIVNFLYLAQAACHVSKVFFLASLYLSN